MGALSKSDDADTVEDQLDRTENGFELHVVLSRLNRHSVRAARSRPARSRPRGEGINLVSTSVDKHTRTQ